MLETETMLIAERKDLVPVKKLIDTPLIYIELFENKNGNLFLASNTIKPGGTVYYATMPSPFFAFLDNIITLQILFSKSPSLFMEVSKEEGKKLYCCSDAEIILALGDKTLSELKSL